MASPSYESWSREDLIARLKLLDATLPTSRTHAHPKQLARKAKTAKTFDFASQPRRKIALKLCYAGWEYNGLAFQKDKTPLPTVEGTLYKALSSCRLIDPELGPEGCGWERCGRTDRGVSSAGQVVSLWVRSNQAQFLPEAAPSSSSTIATEGDSGSRDSNTRIAEAPVDDELPLLDLSGSDETSKPSPAAQFQNPDELPYVSMLNRVLPPTIRIIAWAPVSPTFSSRFSCRHRHYKYFFTSDGLDVSKMRDAAERLLGENDFRNLCKLDASKQIVSFKRKILRADISPVSIFVDQKKSDAKASPEGGIYVFDLVGTAFLYHQVRHIMAILLFVGCGLEPPSIMTTLLNTDKSNPLPPFRVGEHVPEVVECKPEYQMADGLPLMLWDCAYSEDEIVWQTGSSSTAEEEPVNDTAEPSESMGEKNLYNQMHSIHSRSLIHAALDAHFFHAVSAFHSPQTNPFPLTSPSDFRTLGGDYILNIPIGGGCCRRWTSRTYVPLLQRKRLEPVEVVNERWRLSKGLRRENRKANVEEQGDEWRPPFAYQKKVSQKFGIQQIAQTQ